MYNKNIETISFLYLVRAPIPTNANFITKSNTMKRLSAYQAIACLLLFSSVHSQDATPVKNSANTPYKIDFNNLSTGTDAYSKKVLNAWKAFDNNQLAESADLFTDDVKAYFPDGSVIKGKEQFFKLSVQYRNSLAAVSSTVDACTTLKSPAHPGIEVTVIWGEETDTQKDGSIVKTAVHEAWFFNKAGKVFEFHQYTAKTPKQ